MIRPDFLRALARHFERQMRRADRRPPPKPGEVQPVVSPNGPLPFAGGSEAAHD